MLHRFRTWMPFTLVLVTILISTSIVKSQEATPEAAGLRPDAPTYAVHGPYWVGTREMEIPEKDGKPALKLTVWYPALNPNNRKERIIYHPVMKYDPVYDLQAIFMGHALDNPAPDPVKAPYPLVVFSHGFASSPSYYAYLVEHIASYGFIVLAPDHIEMNHFTEGTWKDIALTSIDRPQDIIRTLDYAENLNSSGDFKGLIDMKQVAVGGHSYGGYTALATAGARYDLKAFNARCAALAKDDPNQAMCTSLVPFEKDMAERAGLNPMPEGLWPAWSDPRVKTIITMAGDSYMFDKAGLAEIKIPVLAMGGTVDDSTPYQWGVRPTYDDISSKQKILVTFENANHYMFLTKCAEAPWINDEVGAYFFCSDTVWDLDRAHDLINHFTTAYLLEQLKGDKDAAKALAPDAVSFPGIQYESQGF